MPKTTSLVDASITKAELQHLTKDLAPLAQSDLSRLKQEYLAAGHQYLFLEALRQLTRMSRRNQLNGIELLRIAQAMGIATDKSLLLAGRPTSLIGGVHEVRHSLPSLLEKVIRVAARSLPEGTKALPNAQLDETVVESGT